MLKWHLNISCCVCLFVCPFLVHFKLLLGKKCFGADWADQARPMNLYHVGLVRVSPQYLYLAVRAVIDFMVEAMDTEAVL